MANSLFRFQYFEDVDVQKTFSESFCSCQSIQALADRLNVEFTPFSGKKDILNMDLLFPAMTKRELAVSSNVKSQLADCPPFREFPQNFITCKKNGKPVFVLGYAELSPTILSLHLVSSVLLKQAWGHIFSKTFSVFLSFLLQFAPKRILCCECFVDEPKYSRFAKHYGFIQWDIYTYNGRSKIVFVFCPSWQNFIQAPVKA